MITRYAFFHGKLKQGKESEMREFVAKKLTPLWRQFTDAQEVRVLHGVEQDPNGPEIPLVLAITYADHQAMQNALASSARYKSRDILPELYDSFFEDVSLVHYVFDSEQYSKN